jgi:hypothetical protein
VGAQSKIITWLMRYYKIPASKRIHSRHKSGTGPK